MLKLVSFPSFISLFVQHYILQCASCAFIDEKNEMNEERRRLKQGLISLISCSSFFSLFVSIQDTTGVVVKNSAFAGQFAACFCLASSGAISESQHTRCAHRALPGLAGGYAPSTPWKNAKGKRPKP